MINEKAVIFDMDGTLLNSLKDIAICSNIVLDEFNLPVHQLEDYKNFVGGGIQVLIENCTPNNISEELFSKIFERFKEELRAGKSLRAALDAGFRRAFTAVFDANMTTIIGAIILFYMGSGNVKGFALTLLIGVISSFFTAITCNKIFVACTSGDGFDKGYKSLWSIGGRLSESV